MQWIENVKDCIKPNISIITLYMNCLNIPIQTQKMSKGLKEKQSYIVNKKPLLI